MPRTRPLLLLLLLSLVGVAAAKKPVTLDAVTQYTSPDEPSEISWAPDGDRFAFKQGNKILLYDVPSRTETELVSISSLEDEAREVPDQEAFDWENRRVAEQTLQWFPSGNELLISAGGDLFVIPVAEGVRRQLTSTSVAERDPKLSPDGKRVSFRRMHDLYCLEIASGKVKQLTRDGSDTILNAELDWVYPEELDLGTAHWWSPDSERIAYLQFDVNHVPLYPHADLLKSRAQYEPQRFPQAGDPNSEVRLGVVSADGGRTKWMKLGRDEDWLTARVCWFPDSRALAVHRLNRVQNRMELLRADARSGSSRRLLRETDKYWINLHDHLRILAGGEQFLWSSHKDGFQHLYLYTSDGRKESQLTRGEWEVTDVAGVDEVGGLVFYVSSEDSPLQRSLYVLELDGGKRRRVSTEAGTHSISMGPGCRYYIDTFSSLTSPPRSTIHRSDGSEWAVFRKADRTWLDEYAILPAEIVTVRASDDTQLYARLIKPADFNARKNYPAIVFVYGGPGYQSVQDEWQGLSLEQALAHSGFVIWQLDNRGSAGRGHEWETAVFRNFGAKESEDQREGVQHLISMGFVDESRLGVYGWSYGGYMTLYMLTHVPDLFSAGVAGAPVTDWRNYDTIYTERYMGLPEENREGYRRSSPVHASAKLKAKLLLIHNFEDDNVLFQNSLQMADALQRAGKQFQWMVYPKKTHGVTGTLRTHMLELIASFFAENLKE